MTTMVTNLVSKKFSKCQILDKKKFVVYILICSTYKRFLNLSFA